MRSPETTATDTLAWYAIDHYWNFVTADGSEHLTAFGLIQNALRNPNRPASKKRSTADNFKTFAK
ncbi:MAG: hypothetical protein Rhob2KO_51660 [Rhodopirellula baltica]